MLNPIALSFQKHQIAQSVSVMLAGTGQQILETSQFDEQALDKAPGLGQVKLEDVFRSAELSYDPETQLTKSFHFKSNAPQTAPNGQVLIPAGMESAMERGDDGVETYSQSIPTPNGVVQNKVVVDPNTETINVNNETTLSFQENLASGGASTVVGAITQQLAAYSQIDNQPGLDSAPEAGKIRASDQELSVELDYDPQTRAASHFSFEAHQDIPSQGLPKGLKRSMSRDANGVETYTQLLPAQDGSFLAQETKVDPVKQVVTFNEWIVN